MSFFIWLEGTAVSEWIRGSPSLWGFPFILYLHTLGLALIAGLSSAVALAILFLPERLPRTPLAGLFPLMWIGLAINALSGLALLVAYPAKALTNPVFYIKLVAIAAALGILQWLQRRWTAAASGHPEAAVARGAAASHDGAGTGPAAVGDASPAAVADAPAMAAPGLRRAAWSLLALWLVATLTGRFLAYTHTILMAREALYF